jgi:hypothetical protein
VRLLRTLVVIGLAAAAMALSQMTGRESTEAHSPTASTIPPALRSSLREVIAYGTRAGDIWVMRGDGSHRRRVTQARGKIDVDSYFSPDDPLDWWTGR